MRTGDLDAVLDVPDAAFSIDGHDPVDRAGVAHPTVRQALLDGDELDFMLALEQAPAFEIAAHLFVHGVLVKNPLVVELGRVVDRRAESRLARQDLRSN